MKTDHGFLTLGEREREIAKYVCIYVWVLNALFYITYIKKGEAIVLCKLNAKPPPPKQPIPSSSSSSSSSSENPKLIVKIALQNIPNLLGILCQHTPI